MAILAARTKGFPGLISYVAEIATRARDLPRSYRLETTEKVAVVQHSGGRQTVTRPMQRAIAAKTGEAPPAVGRVLRHQPRPMRVTPRTAKDAAVELGRFVLRGGARGVEPIMRRGVAAQLAAGGIPSWPASRDWGRLKAASPVLGGAGRSVGSAWRSGRYVERR